MSDDGDSDDSGSIIAAAATALCRDCGRRAEIVRAAKRSRMLALVRKERRFAIVMVVSVCVFVVCWTPGWTIFLVSHIV